MNVHNEVMDPERTGLGEPHPVQMISPSGERRSPNGYELDTLEITDLMTMYRSMALLRRLDQEATALQRQGELGPPPRHPGPRTPP
ncbi:TPP-dependent pyruvate/acetoin dehydrogenase alpha subunit [Kocuria marina]